jgi:hypothetical protein
MLVKSISILLNKNGKKQLQLKPTSQIQHNFKTQELSTNHIFQRLHGYRCPEKFAVCLSFVIFVH